MTCSKGEASMRQKQKWNLVSVLPYNKLSTALSQTYGENLWISK